MIIRNTIITTIVIWAPYTLSTESFITLLLVGSVGNVLERGKKEGEKHNLESLFPQFSPLLMGDSAAMAEFLYSAG